MPKQLILREVRRQSPYAERIETVRSLAQVVDVLGEEVLAGAAFAVENHGGRRWRKRVRA